jgi:hypothetical protein
VFFIFGQNKSISNNYMDKITLLLAAFLFTITATAQDSPGSRPELLMDKTVKVKPLTAGILAYEKGYDNFYADEKMVKRYAETKDRRTKHDALQGRVFTVTGIRPFESSGTKNFLLHLNDTLSNEAVYYKFNQNCEVQGKYYFEVLGGLEYPDDFFCDYLKTEEDKAAGEKKLIATIAEGIHVIKVKKGSAVIYRMEAVTVEQVISMLKGVTLVFENGGSIVKPEAEVQMSTNKNDNIVYFTTFELTPADVSLLTQSRLLSGKISRFEKTYTEGQKLQGMVNCLLTHTTVK